MRFEREHCLVGNFDSQLRQQFGRFGACICTSHWRSFSSANGSPGWRTSGFIAKVALLSVSSRSEAASRLACSISRRFFFIFSRCMSAALSERDA
uniref:Uncharacterized protein n=1 Tax=Anopheles funestus TaxID=62324 RepID=A0A182S380_ANOFN